MLNNQEIYQEALVLMKEEDSMPTLMKAVSLLSSLPQEFDAGNNLAICRERLDCYEKYYTAKNLSVQNVIEELDKAILLFTQCLTYKDSAELKLLCENKRNDLERWENEEKNKIYYESKKLFATNNFADLEKALEMVRSINGYRDTELLYRLWQAKRKEALYNESQILISQNTHASLNEAITKLEKIKGYKNVDGILRDTQLARDRFVIDESEKKKKKKFFIIGIIIAAIFLFVVLSSFI